MERLILWSCLVVAACAAPPAGRKTPFPYEGGPCWSEERGVLRCSDAVEYVCLPAADGQEWAVGGACR